MSFRRSTFEPKRDPTKPVERFGGVIASENSQAAKPLPQTKLAQSQAGQAKAVAEGWTATSGGAWRNSEKIVRGGIGALLIGLYIAMHACFIGEFLVIYLHIPILVVAPTAIAILIVGLASGRIMRFFQSPVAFVYLLMLVFWVLSMIFFSFKGHYVPMLQYIARYHLFPLFACALLPTVLHVRRAVRLAAIGFLTTTALCLLIGKTDIEGRFGIPETSLQNPNDLAFNLMIGSAFLTIFLAHKSFFLKAIGTAGILGSAYFALRTGSRANLIVMIMMLLVSLVVLKGRARAGLFALCISVGILGVIFIPDSMRARLVTITGASGEDVSQYQFLQNAVGSTEARLALQQRAIKLALQNPVLGVGPGMYMYALNDMMVHQEGFSKGSWQAAHNTYLELWAETGTPAFLIYLFGVGWCVVINYRSTMALQKRGRTDLIGSSFALLLSSVAFAVGTLFCNVLYQSPYVFMIGLTAANQLALADSKLLRSESEQDRQLSGLPHLMRV